MTYQWFRIFNTVDFLGTGLTSQEFSIILEGVGLKTVLITKGFGIGLTYNDVFLKLNVNNRNPYYFDSHAIAFDENDDVWLGIGS